MKKLNEILQQKPVFLNNWSSLDDVIADFSDEYIYRAEVTDKHREKFKDYNILFASYGTPSYEGYAWVLFEQNGKLFEVEGSHCSCYGLEGQFEPNETFLDVLEHRLLNGTFGEEEYCENSFKKELCDFLGVEYKSNIRKY